jgi:gluconokinase
MAEPNDRSAPGDVNVLVIMGVTGVGKTSVGLALTERLGWEFQECDRLHPPANVAKMRSGVPLTDEDRWPWLRTIAALIDRWRAEGRRGIVTCSALKRAYRRVVVGERPDVRLVYLTGPAPLIAQRIAARRGHYMPLSLLPSQLAALEPPGAPERPITLSVDRPPDAVADEIIETLGLAPTAS